MHSRAIILACLAVALGAPAAAQAQVTPQIIGGSGQPPAAFGFMAALVDTRAPSDFEGLFCGGTLVAPMLVLTAAHCTESWSGRPLAPRDVAVVLGRSDLTTAEGERIGVTAIYRDPAFDEGTLLHDAALLQLARPAAEQPVTLVAPEEAALFAPDMPATVLGWGNTVAVGRGSYPAVLRGASTPIIADALCAEAAVYGGDFLPLTMLCAGYLAGGIDSCDGDSGGPLLAAAADGWRQVGIVSWGGAVCAAPDRPGVYTRVAAERPFILAAFAPQAPVLTASDLRDGRVEVRFAPRPGAVATDVYTVQVEPGDVALTVAGSAGSIVLDGLAHDTDLSVSVTAGNAAYGSSPPGRVTARIDGLPRAVGRPVVHGHLIGGPAVCSAVQWKGLLPLRFGYRWTVEGRTFSRERRIVLTRRLAGRRIACEITATNADGHATVRSPTVRTPR